VENYGIRKVVKLLFTGFTIRIAIMIHAKDLKMEYLKDIYV